MVYYSNNVVLFTIDCFYIANNRYFFIICRINYAVNEEMSGRSLRTRLCKAKIDIYFIDATWPPWKCAHSTVFSAEVAVSREQDEKSNAPLSSSRAGFLPPCLINDGVAPGSRSLRNGCFYLPRDVPSSPLLFLHRRRKTSPGRYESDITVIDLARRCRTLRGLDDHR